MIELAAAEPTDTHPQSVLVAMTDVGRCNWIRQTEDMVATGPGRLGAILV